MLSLLIDVPGVCEKVYVIGWLWIKCIWPLCKTEMVIYQSKANINVKFCLVKSLIFESVVA